MPREFGGPSEEEMGLKKKAPEIGSPESDFEYTIGPDGKPTDVIKPKAGKEFPKPERDPKGELP